MIVADDDNLDIAAEYGFPTVEKNNSDLGERFNAGYQYAAAQGADVFVHIGSDDWIHPDVFDILDSVDLNAAPEMQIGPEGFAVWRRGPQMVAQRRIMVCDLEAGKAIRCFVPSKHGCIPWLIPRSALQKERFAPIQSGLMRGIDGALARGMSARPTWIFQEAHDEWCIDWKTDVNVTAYAGLTRSIAVSVPKPPWETLKTFYPERLVDAAKQLSSQTRRRTE